MHRRLMITAVAGLALKRLTFSAVLALAIALALATLTLAASERPYRASFTGAGTGIALDGGCGANALRLEFAVSGVASHMGRFTGTGSNCTELGLLTEAVEIWDGIISLEAADGSTLTLSSEGSQAAPANGTATFAQSMTVTSGSGRFEDAAGEFEMTGVIDFSGPVTSVEGKVSGWLSY